jgi:crossover junction endodeoxyribonuclease RusA
MSGNSTSAGTTSKGEVVPAEPTVYEFEIPLLDNKPPLNANMRLQWYQERQRKVFIRSAVEWRVKEQKAPPAKHITVGVHYRPGDNRRRDPSNLMPTQKPAVDALVRAGLVPDDTTQWVTERMPVIEPGSGPRRLWLRVEVDRG